MSGPFLITLIYQGTEHEYRASFERWGYTHRIAVLIDEITVIFEPDEEGGYRALNIDNPVDVPATLLNALATKLEKLINQA